MVSIATAQSDIDELLRSDLSEQEGDRVLQALAFVQPYYENAIVGGSNELAGSNQNVLEFAECVASVLAQVETDADTRIAALLFMLPTMDKNVAKTIEERFGKEVYDLVEGVLQLMRLHEQTFVQHETLRSKNAAQEAAAQLEVLRKMLLAMAVDMRAVLVRLATRVATLRYFADNKQQDDHTRQYARDTFELYTPLANRLGIWQLK